MLVKDEVMVFKDVRRLTGNAKVSGKPYDMCTVTLIDDDLNQLPFIVPDSMREFDSNPPKWMTAAANKGKQIVCTLEFTPVGYGITGTLKEFEPVDEK
jgi:hypothetical protein